MKRIFILILICIISIAGCSDEGSAVSKPNKGGTQEVNIPNNPEKFPSEPANSPDKGVPSHNTLPLEPPSSDVIEIKEKLFIAQTNDIYTNPEGYLGKTIQYEGIFDSFYYDLTDTTYYYVIRYGPGCCGFDANAGFEVVWEGDYPESGDWVKATGVLEGYEEGGQKYLRLNLSSLTVLDIRGAEYVYQ